MVFDELNEFWKTLTDDVLDDTTLFILFNKAKNQIERRYKLAICEATDSSQTRGSGDTYLTMKSLPTDWRETTKLYLDNTPYSPIPFNKRNLYRTMARRFYIDYKNAQFALTGTGGSSGTINHFYIAKTTDFGASNKTVEVITWPSEFHPLVVYEAAGIYQGNIDPDSISRQLSAAQKIVYEDLLDALVGWDADLKLNAQDNRHGFEDDFNPLDDIGNL